MSYEVGYGKPPKKHQFPKGRSGNEKGRPRKETRDKVQSVDMMSSIGKALRRKIEVNERGVTRKMSILEATINRQIHKALVDGDQKALAQVINLAEKFYRASLEGRTDEPVRIIVTGGLPGD